MTTDSTAFATLPLSAAMLANTDALGYASMTPIQAQSLPVILKGQDLIAQAKTGSGKTAAFGIGLLNPINPRYFGCQALVLCPTRELADQVARSCVAWPVPKTTSRSSPCAAAFRWARRSPPRSMAHTSSSAPQGASSSTGQGHFGARWAQYPGAG